MVLFFKTIREFEVNNQVDDFSNSVGNLLKNRRIEKDLSIEFVAKRLHLSCTSIEDIERNNFTNLHALAYIRGYLSAYARLLGLVEQEVVDIFNSMDVPLPHSDRPSLLPVAASAPSALVRVFSRDNLLRYVSYIIIFSLLLLLGIWWHQESGNINSNGSVVLQMNPANTEVSQNTDKSLSKDHQLQTVAVASTTVGPSSDDTIDKTAKESSPTQSLDKSTSHAKVSHYNTALKPTYTIQSAS